jgi:hypothetical protein
MNAINVLTLVLSDKKKANDGHIFLL